MFIEKIFKLNENILKHEKSIKDLNEENNALNSENAILLK